jgi:hypothetical protein
MIPPCVIGTFLLTEEREILSLLDRENAPPTLEVLARIPTLKQWLQRGKE